MTNSAETSKPVFVVGMNGSGTTMLLDCLDNHPELYGFRRETKVIPYFIQSAGKYGDLSRDENFRRLWDDFRSITFFKYVNNGRNVPLPDNWRDAPRSVSGVIDGTLTYFAKKENKTRWCEKTPMHAQHICLLADAFPDAKFIHIIRDGRSCAASFHRRWGFTPELTVYRWKHIVRDAQRQGSTLPDRYFELRYEDLTNDPECWLKKVCSFLQVPYDASVITLSRVRKHSGSSDAVITKREEYWRTYFTIEQQDEFDRVAGKLLNGLGYSTKNPFCDEDPASWRIKYWAYIDNIRQGIRSIRNELMRSRDGGKWDDLSSRILNAIKQRLTNRV
jgi:hypothetical protein